MTFSAKRLIQRHAARFVRSSDGNIAVIFGLTATLVLGTVGAGIDFSRAYLARQKVSQVATMTCQYASRPSVVDASLASYNGANGGATYSSQVNSFLTKTWSSQGVNLTQTNGAPFTYTQNGPASVSLATTMPTAFLSLMQISTMPISVTTKCYDSPSNIPQRDPDPPSSFVVKEGFEAGAPGSGWQVVRPDGTVASNASSTATTATTAFGYTGSGGAKWRILGYCVEQDHVGTINSSVFEGSNSVELDCDNGYSTGGNSSMSTLAYMPAGSYELRYAYRSRVTYPNYEPTYICGSQASDLSWANDTYNLGNMGAGARTNQINVYLDLNTATNTAPLHTTIDGSLQLAGSNLIDMCVYSPDWVQRSVKINVTTTGYYWLSFAADGMNDSYGGQLDDVQLCRFTCVGTVQDNFPDSWTASPQIFEDTFDSMSTYYNNSTFGYGDIQTSYGTFGTNASGWKIAQQKGWRNSQVNDVNTYYIGTKQGPNALELDADMGTSGVANANRAITRSFLLDPGYYQITYYYQAGYKFDSLGTTTYCGATPTAANLSGLSGSGPLKAYGQSSAFGTYNYDSLIVGTFMSHGQLASYPNSASFRGIPTFTNPDGTTTATPTVPYNQMSIANYNASQVNPLLDICGYSTSWQTRTAVVKIVKPAYYWLTFAALGTSDNVGGWIDDVKITALGSLYGTAPSNAIAIPVPSPQPGATISYTGFSITANPLTP